MIEREPVTVVCSEKGWIRTIKGHVQETAELRFKEGDQPRFAIHAETTDKLLVFATNGRFYTVGIDKLPGGRGFGEPLRLMIDLTNEDDIVTLLVHDPARRLLVAASDGRGFVVPEKDAVAQTRAGRQVLNVAGKVEAVICAPVRGDTVAVVGDNRKLLVFGVEELPEMTRGRGVMLQRYTTGGLADVTTFLRAEGLSWPMGDRTRTETDLTEWLGRRAQTGRMAPRGFPRNNKFAGIG